MIYKFLCMKLFQIFGYFFGLVFKILEAYMVAGIVAVTVGSYERFLKTIYPLPCL